jgi:GNAT superfamily N-acetyltransferase
MVDTIIETYRRARVRRFSIVMSPGPQADEITSWLLRRGFKPGGGHTLYVRDARVPVPPAPGNVRVVRARRTDRDAIRVTLEQGFAIPRSRRDWVMSTFDRGGTEHYLALIGRAPAGTGSLKIAGDLAWLGGGVTRTRWRRRGVHAALIAARLRRAADLGIAWAWSETAIPVPRRPQGSRRNLLRMGFEEVAVRPAFVWTA